MLYYLNYDPAVDKRYVLAYDEKKNGIRYCGKYVLLYQSAISVNAVYKTRIEALRAWGAYSSKQVYMPDGTVVSPCEVFHHDYFAKNIFIPWDDVIGEVWSGRRYLIK